MSFTEWKGNLERMNSLAMTNWEEIGPVGLIDIVAQAIGKFCKISSNSKAIGASISYGLVPYFLESKYYE